LMSLPTTIITISMPMIHLGVGEVASEASLNLENTKIRNFDLNRF